MIQELKNLPLPKYQVRLCIFNTILQDQHVFDNMVIPISGSPFIYESPHFINKKSYTNISIPNAFKYEISFDSRTNAGQGSISICQNIACSLRKLYNFPTNTIPGTHSNPALSIYAPSFNVLYDIKVYFDGSEYRNSYGYKSFVNAYSHIIGWTCSEAPKGTTSNHIPSSNLTILSYVSNPCSWTGVTCVGGLLQPIH